MEGDSNHNCSLEKKIHLKLWAKASMDSSSQQLPPTLPSFYDRQFFRILCVLLRPSVLEISVPSFCNCNSFFTPIWLSTMKKEEEINKRKGGRQAGKVVCLCRWLDCATPEILLPSRALPRLSPSLPNIPVACGGAGIPFLGGRTHRTLGETAARGKVADGGLLRVPPPCLVGTTPQRFYVAG